LYRFSEYVGSTEETVTVKIQRVAYFHATVQDRPGEAYKMLSQLAQAGVNLLAFSAIPTGSDQTQLMIFPEEEALLLRAAKETGLQLSGPQHAFLCHGDDKLGALAEFHLRLYNANINVYASSGVSAGHGRFGYMVYVRADQFEAAAQVLGV